MLHRRGWLTSAGLSWLAQRLVTAMPVSAQPGMPDQVERPPTRSGFGRAKSVMLVIASGGQSQLETWDPRPDAPEQIRGEFSAISTSVPGTFVCEHLPRLARLADRYAIIKSMSHDDLDHGSALYLTLTGQYHPRLSSNPPPREIDHPFCGSVIEQLRPVTSFLRSSVIVNGPALVPWEPGPGQYAGLLGRPYESLIIGDVTSNQTIIPGPETLPEMAQARQVARQSLLKGLERDPRFQSKELGLRRWHDMSTIYSQAFGMLDRPAARNALALDLEKPSLRDRYGRHRAGQSCLLGRRLVEAGVPLVTVIWNHSNRGQDRDPDDIELHGWDTHNDLFAVMRNSLLPRFDQSFSTLLEDMSDRGLLDSTLVICMGEFGRAPLVAVERNFAGTSPGRKHWASVYSIVVAGAGVRGGITVGAADRHAAYPVSRKFGPWDVTATLFHALGIDYDGHFVDGTGRRHLVSQGQPIHELYGS